MSVRGAPPRKAYAAITVLLSVAALLTRAAWPSSGLVALRRGEAHLASGEYTAAEEVLSTALALMPDDPRPALRLASLHAAWGRPQEGLRALEKARGRGGTPPVELHLELLFRAGEWERLEEAAYDYAKDTSGGVAPEALTTALLHQRRCTEAAGAAIDWKAVAPREAQLTWGALHLTDRRAAAVDALCRADEELCALLPACDAPGECPLIVGRALLRQGRPALAACLLDEGVEALADPEAKGEAEAWLGAALERMERPTEARPHLERATALAPDLPLGWLLLGGHDLAGGRLEKARESLARAQRLDPGNPAPCLALANLVAAEGRYPEVETWTEAALTRAPNDPEMWKAVARFYLERNLRQGENPLWAAEGAVRLAPEDAEALSLLGWARLLEGDATGALEALDGALERDPTLAEAHALRAQALSALGREMEAREAMVRATDLGYRP